MSGSRVAARPCMSNPDSDVIHNSLPLTSLLGDEKGEVRVVQEEDTSEGDTAQGAREVDAKHPHHDHDTHMVSSCETKRT